uniref:Uncharacterized protein n=1 Tax=Myoviridae sp. ct0Tg8 TaxID=2826598 RepID=A0A8S5NBS5_9CAUD|nr:MAG TPA: hypothetical protein [Myoviridae sp. ct0Tg8]
MRPVNKWQNCSIWKSLVIFILDYKILLMMP